MVSSRGQRNLLEQHANMDLPNPPPFLYVSERELRGRISQTIFLVPLLVAAFGQASVIGSADAESV